jgi:hypothetical protein
MTLEKWSLFASISGLFVGVGGFTIAFVQLQRTRNAALAAEAAAKDVYQRTTHLLSVASLEMISNRARELLHVLRGILKGEAIERAAVAALELREAVSRFIGAEFKSLAKSPVEWRMRNTSIDEVHVILERGARS